MTTVLPRQPDSRQPNFRQPNLRQADFRQADFRQPDFRQPDSRQQRCGPSRPRASSTRARYLDPVQLVEYTRFVAGEVRAGNYGVEYNHSQDGDRWHRRLYRDRRVDVWLISWLPTQGTQLHDHGGSAGAFTVVTGTLHEAVFDIHRADTASMTERTHATGSSVGFGPRHVHDVGNHGDQPALSVHAYSRPLESMTYYQLRAGALQAGATVATQDPEPEWVT